MAGPTYTYTSNVPQAATQFNLTQAPILSNFRAINELVAVNHVSFNTINDFGKSFKFPIISSSLVSNLLLWQQ